MDSHTDRSHRYIPKPTARSNVSTVLVKTIHAAIAEGKDPKVEVKRRVLNYRNTPHYTTGVAPSELVLGGLIRTKMPMMLRQKNTKAHKTARKNDAEAKRKTKERLDKRKRATESTIKTGDSASGSKEEHNEPSIRPTTI